jgi:hypothetical protein
MSRSSAATRTSPAWSLSCSRCRWSVFAIVLLHAGVRAPRSSYLTGVNQRRKTPSGCDLARGETDHRGWRARRCWIQAVGLPPLGPRRIVSPPARHLVVYPGERTPGSMLVARHREGEPIRIRAGERYHPGPRARQRTACGLGACAGRRRSRTEILEVTFWTAHDGEHPIGRIFGAMHDLRPCSGTSDSSGGVRRVAQPRVVRQRHKTRIALGRSALLPSPRPGYAQHARESGTRG